MTVKVRRKGAEHVTDVESDKEPGKSYEIARLPGGLLACACMSYVFNKDTPKRCKHLVAYTGSHVPDAQKQGRMEPVREIYYDGETFTFTAKRSISFSPI